MYQYSSFEGFEEENAQEQVQVQVQHQHEGDMNAQSQEQAQAQASESGSQAQAQAQEQVAESGSEGEQGGQGTASDSGSGSTIKLKLNANRVIILVLVSLFLIITMMLESRDQNPVSKIMALFSNQRSLILIALVFILYMYVRMMKLAKNINDNEYKSYMTIERHANVALILVLFEAIGLRFTSYWIVWLATYLNV